MAQTPEWLTADSPHAHAIQKREKKITKKSLQKVTKQSYTKLIPVMMSIPIRVL
jgi:hypothetical protein